MKPKLSCLGPEYGAQFEDESVARAYEFRVPYAPEVFGPLAHYNRRDLAGCSSWVVAAATLRSV